MVKRCEICNVELQNDVEYNQHIIGKRHLKNVEHKNFQKRILEHSVFVSSIPRSIPPNVLISFFQQYGHIAKYIIDNHYSIIEYDRREPVDYLLSNPVFINNCKLNIKRRTLFNIPKKTNDNNSAEEEDPINITIIRNKFENETTFNSQFTTFLNAIQLSDTEIAIRYNSICPCLDKIFASLFPNCRTYRFGSTLTGLGFKECDLDIYMDIGEPIHTTGDEKQTGKVNRQLHNLWTMNGIFSKVKSIMYRRRDVFSNIRPILNTTTPIIKFCFIPTNISCDISFKNGFGVYNSLLIIHCLSHDIRIKPLIMLIKYWARQRELTNCGKISNYSLILMIIFYLQQPDPGILPPLMEFQKTCQPKFINGLQVNSDANVTLLKSSNNSNIPELLQGFFQFYINFDFKTNIICPLDGIIHKKQEFNETASLPYHMIIYKEMVMRENVNVYIQDPIELNRNVAAYMSKKLIDSFQAYCMVGADLCISSRTDDYKNLLKSLLHPIHNTEHNKQLVITINVEPYLNVGLPDNFEEREDITDKDQYKKDSLFFTVFNIVKDIFEKVFKLQVVILCAENGTKQQKIKVLSDVHTRKHKELLLRCSGSNNIWFNRESNITILDPSMSALDREAAISSRASTKNIQNTNTDNMNLNFTCKFKKEENPVEIQLTILNISTKKNVFTNFKHIASCKIPTITTKTLMHMLQFKKHY